MVSKPSSGPSSRRDGRIRDYFKAFAAVPKPSPAPAPAPAPPKRPMDNGTRPQADASDRHSKSPRIEEATLPTLRNSGPAPDVHPAPTNLPSSELSSLRSSTPSNSDIFGDDRPITLREPPAIPETERQPADNDHSSRNSSFRGSQRVTKSGQEMVLDSSEEGSDILEDADALLASFQSKKPPTATVPRSPPRLPGNARGRSDGPGRVLRSANAGRASRRELAAVPKYRNSLTTLVARKEAAAAEEAAYQQALQQAAESEQGTAAQQEQARDIDHGKVDGDTLLPLLQGKDRNEVEQLMRAVERTGALQRQTTWSFFKGSAPTWPCLPPFPALHGDALEPLLKDARTRALTLASGYVAEVTAKRGIPPTLLSWMLAAAVAAERPDLRAAALQVVENAGQAITEIMAPDTIDDLFRGIGASDEAIATDLQSPVEPILLKSGGEATHRDLTALVQILKILTLAAQWMNRQALSRTLVTLLTLGADTTIPLEPAVPLALEDALTAFIAAFPEADEASGLLQDCLYSIRMRITDPQLRLQIIRAMPCSTARTCAIRQSLARLFLFKSVPPDGPDLRIATKHVTTAPMFKITSRTDYPALTAQMAMLDIMLGDGRGGSDGNIRVESYDVGDREQERTFNVQVDALADAVKGLMTRIVDTGAAHMARTEAKTAIEALHARLQYSVRTRPRPKQSIFGDLDERESGAERIERFLQGRKDKTVREHTRER